jgi:Matrixin
MDGTPTPDRARSARSRALLSLVAAVVAVVLAPAAVVVAGAGPSPAQRFGVAGPAVDTAKAIAARQWGAPACHGTVTLAWTPAASNVNATSTWSNPVDFYARPQDNEACRIDLNPQAFYDWPKFCTVLVHELGHLSGHRHATDPADVMYPYYLRPLTACAATPDPTATAAPAPTATPRPAAPARPAAAPQRRPAHAPARAAKRPRH